MELKLNIQKKHLYVLVSVLVVIGVILIVRATVPNPGHPPSEIDFTQTTEFNGTLKANNYAEGWSMIAWSLTSVCFQNATHAPGFNGASGVAGNFNGAGGVAFVTPKTGTEICQLAHYNTCVADYYVGIGKQAGYASFDVQTGNCATNRQYYEVVGPLMDSATYHHIYCCTSVF